MRKISFLWLFIAVTLIVTHIGIAQERRPADERPRGDNQGRDYQEREQSSDEAQARAERAMNDVLKVMKAADKLTDEQADELLKMVFPPRTDWEAKYQAYLKENPAVAKAVESSKITKEKVIAGIKSRAGEKAPTEEEQLEALHQRLLKDDPTLGRTPKAELMPRLKTMLERGEGKNLRPEKSTRQRLMSFGLYLNGLIESGQVDRFDKDLKRVHDLGVAEIERQGEQKERGQAADRARDGRGREEAARGDERPLSPAVARLHREAGSFDFTARINMDAVGQDGGVIDLQGTADLQMILDGQFLLSRGLQGGNESVTIIGVTGGDDDEYFRFSLDGGQTGFMYAQGGLQEDGSRVLTHPGGERGPDYAFRTTFEDNGGFTTSFLVGPQQAEFLNVTHTRTRRQPIDVLETMLSSPVTPTYVNRSANSPDPGANFSPEHLVLQEFAGDFEAEGGAGEVRSRMICQGRFLISELSVDGDDVVVLTGFDSAKKRFGQIVLDPKTPGYRLLEGTQQADGTIVLAASDGRGGLAWTLTRHKDGGYTFDDGGRSMRFRPNVGERARGAVGERPGKPGTLKWSVPLGGGVGYHSAAIAEDGTIYMAADGQRIVALNPDGTVKWTFVASSGYPTAGAAIGKDGTIYIGTWSQDGSDSRIYAITADGTEKWSYPVGDKIDFSSPAIAEDGTIYVGCYDDHLYAMNPDGTKKWSFRAEFNIFSSPAVGQDGTIYVASENGKLYAVNPEDGTEKWSFQTGAFIHGSPSIAEDGAIYIGSSDKHLYALNPDGSEKWRFMTEDQVHAPPAIGKDGTLYVGSNDGKFYAINPDGTNKWDFQTGLRVDNCSAAIGKDGTIYFGSDDNHIYALNPDGSEKWRLAMGGVDDMDSSPAIGEDGTIYVGSRDGNLYAIYGESGGLAETPWPMFGCDLRHIGRAQLGMAHDRNQDTSELQRRAEQRERAGRQRLHVFIMQRLDSLLERVGESVGQRYELDEITVNSLRQDVRESVRAQLDQGKGDKLAGAARVGGMDLLEMLLSQPEYKAAFAKHLNEEQLQDYLDFTRARRQGEQRAVNRQLIADLDQQLSLTADQRKQIEQILGTEKTTDEWWSNSMNMMAKFDIQESVNTVHGLKVPIDKILSKSQSSIWQLLVAPSDEPDPRLIQYREAEAEINKAVEAGRITREQANERLVGLRQRLWATDNRKPETENRLRLIAEAKLAAHTEQLGPLDERASKRLALAAKGVVEQYLESQDTGQRKDPTEMDDDEFEKAAGEIRRMVAAGRITREQAAQRLERMKLRTRGKDESEPRISTDITNHPLYQQTIKDVLSDEAFAQYKARQAERQAFRLQAGRDLVVASIDTLLMLDESQRQHFEKAVAKLSTPSANDRIPIPVLIFIQLFDPTVDGRNIVIHPDSDILSEWQRERLGEYASNFGEWVAIDNTVRQRR